MHRTLSRTALLLALSLLPLSLALGGCDDPLGLGDAQIAADSIDLELASPGSVDPSAIDVLSNPPGLRYPERSVDAQEWDVQLRRAGAGFVLAPFTSLGGSRAAGIVRSGTDYAAVDEAPRGRSQYSLDPVSIQEGATYFIRSRNLNCVKYGVVKVVDLDAAAGTGRFVIRSNIACDDERLPLPDAED
ncbi:MAG TPA: hypothetical protein VHG91_18605 [Longimicrobium sp.]|nr:hypothetical protein [Longimicrobium sp.]